MNAAAGRPGIDFLTVVCQQANQREEIGKDVSED